MNNPIPAPRRPVDTRPTGTTFTPTPPRPALTTGPACVSCDHRTCRSQRARSLPRLGGHRSEYAREHAQAAQLQSHYRHLIVYYGEATQSFWAATPTGLIEAFHIDALLLALWTHPDPPALRPRARDTGANRVPARA